MALTASIKKSPNLSTHSGSNGLFTEVDNRVAVINISCFTVVPVYSDLDLHVHEFLPVMPKIYSQDSRLKFYAIPGVNNFVSVSPICL